MASQQNNFRLSLEDAKTLSDYCEATAIPKSTLLRALVARFLEEEIDVNSPSIPETLEQYIKSPRVHSLSDYRSELEELRDRLSRLEQRMSDP